MTNHLHDRLGTARAQSVLGRLHQKLNTQMESVQTAPKHSFLKKAAVAVTLAASQMPTVGVAATNTLPSQDDHQVIQKATEVDSLRQINAMSSVDIKGLFWSNFVAGNDSETDVVAHAKAPKDAMGETRVEIVKSEHGDYDVRLDGENAGDQYVLLSGVEADSARRIGLYALQVKEIGPDVLARMDENLDKVTAHDWVKGRNNDSKMQGDPPTPPKHPTRGEDDPHADQITRLLNKFRNAGEELATQAHATFSGTEAEAPNASEVTQDPLARPEVAQRAATSKPDPNQTRLRETAEQTVTSVNDGLGEVQAAGDQVVESVNNGIAEAVEGAKDFFTSSDAEDASADGDDNEPGMAFGP